jgi:hypothetical protein
VVAVVAVAMPAEAEALVAVVVVATLPNCLQYHQMHHMPTLLVQVVELLVVEVALHLP